MKYYILIGVFSVSILSTLTYADKEIKNNDASNIKEKSKQSSNKKQQKQWPPIFVPSEKINADSSVSFPVDI